jgi:hypothetical protein
VPGKPFNRYHPVELVDCCGISEVGSLFGAHSVQSGSPLRRWPIPATAGQPTYPARIFQISGKNLSSRLAESSRGRSPRPVATHDVKGLR